MKIRKGKNSKARLKSRITAHEDAVKRDKSHGRGLRKPGSQNPKKGVA